MANRITKYSMLIFCGTGQISEIRSFADLNGYRSRLIVWDKEHCFSKKRGDNLYGPNNETAIYIQKDGSRFSAQGKGCQFKALPHIRNIPFGQVPPHPTMKPVSLFKEFILDNTFTGDIVFDPCMGSGTAAIAAIETGRQFLGCELDKKFYSDAVIRINKALYRA